MKVIKTQHGTNLLKHLDCCISYYVLSDPPHRPAGGGVGSGNSENFINTNIYSGAEKPFGKCATEYYDNFETKKHVSQSSMDGESRGNKEI